MGPRWAGDGAGCAAKGQGPVGCLGWAGGDGAGEGPVGCLGWAGEGCGQGAKAIILMVCHVGCDVRGQGGRGEAGRSGAGCGPVRLSVYHVVR